MHDPQDPGQPIRFVPRLEDATVIEPYVRVFTLNGAHELRTRERMRDIMKEFLILSFLAETGIKPSECAFLERHDAQHNVYWSYHRKDPGQDTLAGAEIMLLKAKVAELTRSLEAANEKIKKLISTRGP